MRVWGCRAVGRYRDAAYDRHAYFSTITSEGEVVQILPDPVDAAPDAETDYRDLECPAFDWCLGVGEYRTPADDLGPAVLELVGGVPTVTRAPAVPGDPYPAGFLAGVDCSAVRSCVAVGGSLVVSFGPSSVASSAVPAIAHAYPVNPDGHEASLELESVAVDSPTTAVAVGRVGSYAASMVGVPVG